MDHLSLVINDILRKWRNIALRCSSFPWTNNASPHLSSYSISFSAIISLKNILQVKNLKCAFFLQSLEKKFLCRGLWQFVYLLMFKGKKIAPRKITPCPFHTAPQLNAISNIRFPTVRYSLALLISYYEILYFTLLGKM